MDATDIRFAREHAYRYADWQGMDMVNAKYYAEWYVREYALTADTLADLPTHSTAFPRWMAADKAHADSGCEIPWMHHGGWCQYAV